MTPSTTQHAERENRPDPCPSIVVHRNPSTGITLFSRVDARIATSLYVRLDEPSDDVDETVWLRQLGQCAVERIKSTATKREHAFLSLLRTGSSYPVDLWVDATRHTWSQATRIEESFRHLSEDLKATYPGIDLTMEINAASDVSNDLNCDVWHADVPVTRSRLQKQPSETSYIDARNTFFDLVKRGFVFSDSEGHPRTEELVLPEELLDRRMPSLPDGWRCLTIWGAAGTGKTQVALWFAHQLSTTKAAIVAELDTRDCLLKPRDEDGAIGLDILGALKGVLESRFRERSPEPDNPVVRRACADIAEKLLRDPSIPTVFIADNLDSFQKLRDWVKKAVDILPTIPFDIRIISRLPQVSGCRRSR